MDSTKVVTSTDVAIIDPNQTNVIQKLSPKSRFEVRKLVATLEVSNPTAISTFGAEAQAEMVKAADTILQMVIVKDAGPAAGILTDLLRETKSLDPKSLVPSPAQGLGARLGSLLRGAQDAVKDARIKYQTVSARLDHIVEELNRHMKTMDIDIQNLDGLYNQTLSFYEHLLVFIAAGDQVLENLHEKHNLLVEEAKNSSDPLKMQEVADQADLIARVERRVHDLRLTSQIALQSLPQIRLIQRGDLALRDKLQTSIVTTLPLWKQQIAIAITLANQEGSLKAQRDVTDKTNQLLLENSQLLRTNAAGVAKEVERGVVELQTLQTTQDNLIATITDVLAIQEEGRKRRAQEEVAIQQLQQKMQEQLVQQIPARTQ